MENDRFLEMLCGMVCTYCSDKCNVIPTLKARTPCAKGKLKVMLEGDDG